LECSACWLRPDGVVVDVGCRRHIDLIIDDPAAFGETAASVAAEYRMHGEPLRHEGRARAAIMLRVVRRGFVRVRRKRNHWSVELWEPSPETVGIIAAWAAVQLRSTADIHADVHLAALGISAVARVSLFGLSKKEAVPWRRVRG